jgi:hypothetical protein
MLLLLLALLGPQLLSWSLVICSLLGCCCQLFLLLLMSLESLLWFESLLFPPTLLLLTSLLLPGVCNVFGVPASGFSSWLAFLL